MLMSGINVNQGASVLVSCLLILALRAAQLTVINTHYRCVCFQRGKSVASATKVILHGCQELYLIATHLQGVKCWLAPSKMRVQTT